MKEKAAPRGRARACPFVTSCHFPKLPTPTAGDEVLRLVYCRGVWSQCSIHALLAHGHEASECLWPDGEVKVAEPAAN